MTSTLKISVIYRFIRFVTIAYIDLFLGKIHFIVFFELAIFYCFYFIGKN